MESAVSSSPLTLSLPPSGFPPFIILSYSRYYNICLKIKLYLHLYSLVFSALLPADTFSILQIKLKNKKPFRISSVSRKSALEHRKAYQISNITDKL